MITLKNILITGCILLFIGIALPLAIIGIKGFFKKPDHKRKEEPRNIIFVIIDYIWGSFIGLLVVPSLIFFIYNYFMLVIKGDMLFDAFIRDFFQYSAAPVILFYMKAFAYVRQLIQR